jgi:two-component system, cell cycle sensor histidine kinase and response regulator CckA
MITVILKRDGYEVLTAASGVEALEVWRERGESIQLLITDMVMPMGMTGRQLADRLWRDRPSLKVIFTSGYIAVMSGVDSNMSDQADFLQKPFTASRLSGTVPTVFWLPSPLRWPELTLSGTR